MSSCFAAFVAACARRGHSSLRPLDASGRFPAAAALLDVVVGFFKATAWQSVVEYYWHRLMHHRVFYRVLHKIHHHYKSPSVWCDLCIHPVEAFGYYVILYSPAFVIDASVASFIAYMSVMGVCGVFDHSGLRFRCYAGAYETTFTTNITVSCRESPSRSRRWTSSTARGTSTSRGKNRVCMYVCMYVCM